MKLHIEIWIQKKKLAAPVLELFNEAVISYKAGAYRASLLFSYLGYMSIIKNRLIRSKLPTGVPQGLWDQILNDLQNEESWDKTSFEATQRKNPSPIFNIPDSLRREILYWKDKRNECAHFRNVIIGSHHVDSFWDFTITTIPKITVIGGKNSLLQKFYNHFDISLTPKGTEYVELIKEIEYSVDDNELESFFQNITKNLEGDFFEKNTYIEIFEKIFATYDGTVSNKLVEFLKKDSNILVEFLRENPGYIETFSIKKEGIRKLWFDLLFKSGNNDYPLYVAMLQHNLIPEEEYEESHNKVIPRVGNFELSTSQISILKQTNFFEVFHNKHVYHGPYFKNQMADNYSSLIVAYINEYGITEKLANSLSKTLKSNSPPYSLKKKIKELFNSKPKIEEEFIMMCESKDLDIPSIVLNNSDESL